MSQNKQILQYLKEHPNGLTSMDAIVNFRCTRLAARIKDIKDYFLASNELIESEKEVSNGKSYVRYIYKNNINSQFKMF